ncbi:MAG: hypothetical protein KDC87_02805 [Planctomycetes bacterium]|nr:hypothetical protein [Planctomycetota bacterium]
MKNLFRLLCPVLLFAATIAAQDMTTIHVGGRSAIHTKPGQFGDERDPLEWADNGDELNIDLGINYEGRDGKKVVLKSKWTLRSREMTRHEVALRIARDFRTCLIEAGMLGQDALDVCSTHGATVYVSNTPRANNPGTVDDPKVNKVKASNGPSTTQYVDGPDGR